MPQLRLYFLTTVIIAAAAVTGDLAAAELPNRPLTLDECVELALRHNPSLTIVAQDVRASAAGLRRSASGYYPSAKFFGVRGRTGGTSFLETATGILPFSTATERSEAEVRLNQVVWEVGRKESIRSARHTLSASRAREQAAIGDLVLAIARGYYATLAAEQLVGVAQANLAASLDHRKLVAARVQVGEAPPVDLAPAEADAADAEFALLQSENGADLAKAQLKRAMGVPPTYRLRLARPEGEPEGLAIPSLEDSLALAFARRPELMAAREAVEAGGEGVRLANLRQWGGLALSAEYDIGIAGPKRGTDSWAAVLAVTGVLFDDGSRRADADAARAGLESLKAQEQELVNGIGLEVESALLDVATARKSVEAAGKAVASAEAQLAAAQGKYRQGVGIFVEILDAQEAVARARSNRVRALFDHQTALVSLKRATGTLMPPVRDESGL